MPFRLLSLIFSFFFLLSLSLVLFSLHPALQSLEARAGDTKSSPGTSGREIPRPGERTRVMRAFLFFLFFLMLSFSTRRSDQRVFFSFCVVFSFPSIFFLFIVTPFVFVF